MYRRTLAVTVALLALAGCSSQPKADNHAAASSSKPADPYATYVAADTHAGLTPEVQRDEAVKVAGNTCDNTVTDMSGLLTNMQQLYSGQQYQDFLTDRANFIDAYCPNARVIYDAATQQTVGKVIPATH